MPEADDPTGDEIKKPSPVDLLKKEIEELKKDLKSLEDKVEEKSECPNQWKLDVNDRYQKAVGVVTTLSTAALVLPIFFVKDIAKINGVQSIAGALSSRWIYAGWPSLGLSILAGIIYYFVSAKWVKLAWGKEKTDIFGKKVTDRTVEKWLDRSYFFMMTGFIAGFVCILAFIVSFSLKAPAITSTQINCRGGFEAIGKPIGPFIPGENNPSKTADVGKFLTDFDKKMADCGKPIAIFLIGSTDRRVLEGKLQSLYGENAGLARARADYIKDRLSPAEDVMFVPLISGPAWHGPESDPENKEMAKDRSVSVYGLWKTKSDSGNTSHGKPSQPPVPQNDTPEGAPPQNEHRYGAIIDAGSGNSRLAIFEWSIADGGTPEVKQIAFGEAEDGSGKECPLTLLPGNQNTCQCLTILTENARTKATVKLPPIIPLWVKATAGVRRLDVLPNQEAILYATHQCLRNLTDYEWRGTEVISGPKEGVFAWLAVNYRANKLQADDVADTLGIVEMGGQSAQIAYRIAGPNLPAPAPGLGEIVTVPLAPRELNIYSVSHFLGNKAAIKKMGDPSTSTNECAQDKDPPSCVEKITPFLMSYAPQGKNFPGGLKENLSPPTNMHFAGLANFTHVVRNIVGQGNLKNVEARANEICGSDDKKQVMRAETFEKLKVKKKHRPDVCFNAFYTTQLVSYGWNISLEKVSPPGPSEPSWTLGAMIFEAARMTGAGPHR